MVGLNVTPGRGAALSARTVSGKRRASTPSSFSARVSRVSALSLVIRGMRYSSRKRPGDLLVKHLPANMPG